LYPSRRADLADYSYRRFAPDKKSWPDPLFTSMMGAKYKRHERNYSCNDSLR